jgi:hypothetical protein
MALSEVLRLAAPGDFVKYLVVRQLGFGELEFRLRHGVGARLSVNSKSQTKPDGP